MKKIQNQHTQSVLYFQILSNLKLNNNNNRESFPIRDPPKIKQDIKQHLDVACFLLAVEVEKLNKECS